MWRQKDTKEFLPSKRKKGKAVYFGKRNSWSPGWKIRKPQADPGRYGFVKKRSSSRTNGVGKKGQGGGEVKKVQS